jgi:hypothetical protein
MWAGDDEAAVWVIRGGWFVVLFPVREVLQCFLMQFDFLELHC